MADHRDRDPEASIPLNVSTLPPTWIAPQELTCRPCPERAMWRWTCRTESASKSSEDDCLVFRSQADASPSLLDSASLYFIRHVRSCRISDPKPPSSQPKKIVIPAFISELHVRRLSEPAHELVIPIWMSCSVCVILYNSVFSIWGEGSAG